ncbi:YbaB/EbfC family nucleoid-associated protein [Nocardia salmonicida]|uniref:YbaB/EbfC family nucleoid-associated protein n=1 Tax=Nocardia salmonicida TaxID=53431 RepID=UPI0033CAB39D
MAARTIVELEICCVIRYDAADSAEVPSRSDFFGIWWQREGFMLEEADSAQLDYLQEALLRIRGTVSSSDGSVTVEVGANGALHAVRLSDPGPCVDPQQLVDHVVDLHRLAHAEAGEAMRATLEDLQAEAAMDGEPEHAGDDPAEQDAGPDPQPPSPTDSDSTPSNGEPPREDTDAGRADSPPDEMPDHETTDRSEGTSEEAGANSHDDVHAPALAIQPPTPSDHHRVYDVIAPGDDNPYATVIVDPPAPRRVPPPSRVFSRSYPDIEDRSAPHPAVPAQHDPISLSEGDSPSIHDYLRYDYLGRDDPWCSPD